MLEFQDLYRKLSRQMRFRFAGFPDSIGNFDESVQPGSDVDEMHADSGSPPCTLGMPVAFSPAATHPLPWMTP